VETAAPRLSGGACPEPEFGFVRLGFAFVSCIQILNPVGWIEGLVWVGHSCLTLLT